MMQLKLSKFVLAILSQILLISFLTLYAEPEKNTTNKKSKESDVKTTELVAENLEEEKDGSRFILNCAECHGFDGNSINLEFPSIASLNEKYIIRQLEDFKTGKRDNKKMMEVVKEFPSNKELSSLASYFSMQRMFNQNTDESIKNHEFVNLKIGEEIFTGKRVEYGIPACSACHGKDGLGDKEGVFPRLAGQQMDYLIKQMEDFRSGERSNDMPPQMRNIAKQMDDEDIASVAAYIAYMGL